MDMITLLKSKNNTAAYQFLLRLEQESKKSDSLYGCLDDFLTLLRHESSLVRIRGFRLICAQAQWDKDGWIKEHLEELLSMLDDEKSTAVRQCLASLHSAVTYQPELLSEIEKKLDEIDLLQYKESMIPLLQKDIGELRALIQKGRGA